jgi:hypothetical protein
MSADIEASVDAIGLYGLLTPHYEGAITGTSSESGFELFASGCGVDDHTNSGGGTSVDLLVTPTSAGTIQAAIGKKGFDVYTEAIAVEVVYGQLAGAVYEVTRGPIQDAKVKGYPAGSDTTGAEPLFEDLTRADGGYTIEGDLEVGYYDVYVLKFGYLTAAEEVFLQYGANDVDFYLDSAPAGLVSGHVTEMGTGVPLEATVKVYRADNMALYAEVVSNAGAGGYYEVSLPYFNYEMNVRAYHHIPQVRGITVDEATEVQDFVLEATLANILLIADSTSRPSDGVKFPNSNESVSDWNGVRDGFGKFPNSNESVSDWNGVREGFGKFPNSNESVSNWTGAGDDVRSAAQLAADLRTLGYDVVEEASATTNPTTWESYDFVLSASGDAENPVSSASYRAALENFVLNGGKLLIEGGEIGYDALVYPGYASFAANVLHAIDWDYDSSGNLTIHESDHALVTFPNTIGTIAFSYSGWGDQDACDPAPDAGWPTSWSYYPTLSSVIVYDDDDDPDDGQIVFFEFDYLAAGTGRMELLENAVAYLTGQGSSSAVPEWELDGAPSAHVLEGASPNPFNPVTKLVYGMPSQGQVGLRVYNVAGKLVRVLEDGVKDAGYHVAVWDGRDDRGEAVASGVYFARMEAEGFEGSAKMVLLK